MVTETGYCNRRGGSGGHVPVSPKLAGVYLPRLFLNNHRHGIARAFWHELMNLRDKPDDEESNFGLYENDGVTPKPAAGWCFHNGDQRERPDGRPRRSFDLRETSLMEQLDEIERAIVAAF